MLRGKRENPIQLVFQHFYDRRPVMTTEPGEYSRSARLSSRSDSVCALQTRVTSKISAREGPGRYRVPNLATESNTSATTTRIPFGSAYKPSSVPSLANSAHARELSTGVKARNLI